MSKREKDLGTLAIHTKVYDDEANFEKIVKHFQKIQDSISGIKFPAKETGQIANSFVDINKAINAVTNNLKKGFTKKSDFSNFTNNIINAEKGCVKLQEIVNKIDFNAVADGVVVTQQEIEKAQKQADKYQKQLENFTKTPLGNLKAKAGKLNQFSSAKSIQQALDSFGIGDLEGTQKYIKRLEQALAKVKHPYEEKDANGKAKLAMGDDVKQKITAYQNYINALKKSISELGKNPGFIKLRQDMDGAGLSIQAIRDDKIRQVLASLQQMGSVDLKTLIESLHGFGVETVQVNEKQLALSNQLDSFKTKAAYFFGLTNAINLLKRTIYSAYETVKDLDAVMTETAVVTDFSVSDMWEQLPMYTKRANELGVSIHDVYEAATLYYQQGLKTNEVMAITNATLRMGRIAGLEAATATDRMTNALRGFNMELTETNADNVADVYSKLAAVTASNVDEISTAMTKVASLANSANMEFETTAAFLAQMIETTRESAETAGTALKTVVARFSEVKKLYAKGDLTGESTDGEIIDVNKVGEALRSAGIDLNEYLSGAKGLDDIFIELAKTWDSLDIIQQRYIATMAAGSRQQSRFLALMSDYSRTTELVSAAYNATGASQEQYNKTLDSLQTHLTRLKNAWNAFTLDIMDSEIIKGFLSTLTQMITLINNLTEKFGSLGGVAKIALAGFGLYRGKKLSDKVLLKVGKLLRGDIPEQGNKGVGLLAQSVLKILNKTNGKIKSQSKDDIVEIATFAELKAKEAVASIERMRMNQKRDFMNTFFPAGQELQGNGSIILPDGLNTSVPNNQKDQSYRAFQKLRLKADEREILLAEAKINAKLHESIVTGQLTEQEAREYILQQKSLKASQFSLALTLKQLILDTLHNKTIRESIIGLKLYAFAERNKTKHVIAATIATKIYNSVLLSCPVVAVTVAVVALTAAIIGLTVANQNAIKNSPEKQLERAEMNLKEAAKNAREAQSAYEDLSNSLDTIAEKYEKLNKIEPNTVKWKEAAIDYNNAILELIEKYPELAKNLTYDKGVLHLNNEVYDTFLNEKMTQAENAQLAASGALLQRNQKAIDTKISSDVIDTVTKDDDGFFHGLGEDTTTKTTRLVGFLHNGLEGFLGDSTELAVSFEGQPRIIISKDTTTGEITGLQKDGYDSKHLNADELTQKLNPIASRIQEDTYHQEQLITERFVKEGLTRVNLGTNQDVIQNILLDSPERIANLTNRTRTELQDTDIDTLREEYAQAVAGTDYNTWKQEYNDGQDISDEDLRSNLLGIRLPEAVKRYAQTVEKGYKSFNNEFFVDHFDKIEAQQKQSSFQEGGRTNLTYAEVDKIAEDLKDIELEINTYDTQQQKIIDWEIKNVDKQKTAFNDVAKKYAGLLFGIEEGTEVSETDKKFETITDFFKRTRLSATGAETILDLAYRRPDANTKETYKGEQFLSSFEQLTKRMNIQEKERFVQFLGEQNWQQRLSTDELQKELNKINIGISASDSALQNFTQGLYNSFNAVRKIDFKNLVKNVNLVEQVRQGITNNTQKNSFTKEQYDAFVAISTDYEDQFLEDLNGNFIYLGGNLQTLSTSLQDNTGALLTQAKNQTSDKLKAAQYLDSKSEAWKQGISNPDLPVEGKQEYIKDIVAEFATRGLDLTAAGIEGLYSNMPTEIIDTYSDEVLSKIISDILTLMWNKNTLKTEEQEQLVDATEKEYYNTSAHENAHVKGVSDIDRHKILLGQASNAHVSDIIPVTSATGLATASADEIADFIVLSNIATAANIPIDELKQFLRLQTEISDEQGRQLLVALQLRKSYTGITDKYQDWMNLINKGVNKNSIEYQQMLSEFTTNLSTTFGITEETAANALKKLLEETGGNFKDIIQEIVEKGNYNNVFNKIGESYASELGIDNQQYNILTSYFAQAANGNVKALNTWLQNSQLTPEQITKLAAFSGYSLDVSMDALKHLMVEAGGLKEITTTVDNVIVEEAIKKIIESEWKNPYDEYYNLTQETESIVHKRNLTEKKYTALLEKQSTSAATLNENIQQRIAYNKRQLKLEERKQAVRAEQYKGSLEDELLKSYLLAGVVEKGADGFLQINYTKAEGLKDTETGKELEIAVDTANGYLKDSRTAEMEQLNLTDAIVKLEKINIEKYVEVENKVKDALIARDRKLIDDFNSYTQSLSDYNSKILESLRESVSLERQIKDNTKAEDTIKEKQSRLSFLERDTSGAYDLEILQLKKELDEAIDTHTDTLIDQQLSKLEKANQKEIDSRNVQETLMKQTLQSRIDNGEYWNRTLTLIEDMRADASRLPESIVNLFKDTDEFKALSNFQQERYMSDLTRTFLEAVLGEGQAQIWLAKQNREVEYNGKTYNYDVERDRWLLDGSQQEYELEYDLDKKKIKVQLKRYAKGGLADYTGPAWLDGTKSRPEMVLSPRDTQNFLLLRDTLAKAFKVSASNTEKNTNYYTIHIQAEIGSDYDVERLTEKVKKEIENDSSYRNVNSINFIR